VPTPRRRRNAEEYPELPRALRAKLKERDARALEEAKAKEAEREAERARRAERAEAERDPRPSAARRLFDLPTYVDGEEPDDFARAARRADSDALNTHERWSKAAAQDAAAWLLARAVDLSIERGASGLHWPDADSAARWHKRAAEVVRRVEADDRATKKELTALAKLHDKHAKDWTALRAAAIKRLEKRAALEERRAAPAERTKAKRAAAAPPAQLRMFNPRNATLAGRPSWLPLLVGGKPNTDIRDATRNKGAVYLFRRKGASRVEYAGSSTWEDGSAETIDPDRAWKTILRHFQAARTQKTAKQKPYHFGSDNWTADPADGWEVAVFTCGPTEARELEDQAFRKYKPKHLSRRQKAKRLARTPF
jgi:hypothetical protein